MRRVITALAEKPVAITNLSGLAGQVWAAADLEHQIGRRVGIDQWSANLREDKTSGYLASATSAQSLPPGEHGFTVELKVDNCNRENAAVATLSVINLDSRKIEAQRELRRSEFPNVLYPDFVLRFTASTGPRHGFRMFWHHSSDAPRLTQCSLRLQLVGREH